MNIKVEKWIIDDSVSYKILDIEKCCNEIINSKNISINTEYDENETYVGDNPEYSVKIVRAEERWDGEDGYSYFDNYYETIKFCPFCGQEIFIEVVNEVDKTEEYKPLREERDVLWKKCWKTDSKKKESELRKQVNELDNRINSMLASDNFERIGK